ncbi:hypothetical protein Micbo1qcDRAFT_178051 [Microdochium bolleyi]|uniref:Peptidoglycan binding-like domain-containing protein n=1 Tax=Microdochium bolleyi TaxID=196109 RepID=A0A136IU32_9PEZI|nr:hypothetical protein Micbo1qcDRAFT_178051 [Microdochium bolleyi]
MKLLTIATVLTGTASALVTCNSFAFITGSRGYGIYLPTRPGSVECEMGRGSQSEAVRILQTTLNSKCYNYGLDADGEFGAKTEAALKKAQRKHGADDDGIYGPETRKKMAWDAFKAGAVTCLKVANT